MTDISLHRRAAQRDIVDAVDWAESMLYTCPVLTRPGRRYRDRDGRSRSPGHGEWDWFWRLGEYERFRLICRRMVLGGCEPDQVHFYWGAGLGYNDVDSTMWTWLGYTRIADAGRVLLHGHVPRPCAYGGLDANDLFPDTSYDLNLLFGTRTREYLEGWVDPEEEYLEGWVDPEELAKTG
jgi:hypothetical protein